MCHTCFVQKKTVQVPRNQIVTRSICWVQNRVPHALCIPTCPISMPDLCATLQRTLLSSLLQTRKPRCRINPLDNKENASSLQCVLCFTPHLQLLRDSFHFGMVGCCYGLNMAPTEHCKLNSQCNSIGMQCILVTRSWGPCPYRWSDAAA